MFISWILYHVYFYGHHMDQIVLEESFSMIPHIRGNIFFEKIQWRKSISSSPARLKMVSMCPTLHQSLIFRSHECCLWPGPQRLSNFPCSTYKLRNGLRIFSRYQCFSQFHSELNISCISMLFFVIFRYLKRNSQKYSHFKSFYSLECSNL